MSQTFNRCDRVISLCCYRDVTCCCVAMVTGDEVSGLTVSIRERDDVIQIWNTNSLLHEQSTIVEKVKELLPSISFSAIFYKGLGGVLYVFLSL